MREFSIIRLIQAIPLTLLAVQSVGAVPQPRDQRAQAGAGASGGGLSSETSSAVSSITAASLVPTASSSSVTGSASSTLSVSVAVASGVKTEVLPNGDIKESLVTPASPPDPKKLGKYNTNLDGKELRGFKDPFPKEPLTKGKPDTDRIRNPAKYAKKFTKPETIVKQEVTPLVNQLTGSEKLKRNEISGVERRTVAGMLNPIATTAPDAKFTRRTTHPVAAKSYVGVGSAPIQTNKFWANLMLGNQNSPVQSMPYELWWSNNANEPWGVSVNYKDPDMRSYGPVQSNGAVEYYVNPIFVRSINFGASEFVRGTSTMELTDGTHMSVKATFYANKASSTSKKMEMVFAQGLGFVSATYTNLTPQFKSSVLFRSVVKQSSFTYGAVKYRITLEDNSIWLLYAWTASGSSALNLQINNNGQITARSVFSGLIQIAKLSKTTAGNSAVEAIYDAATGGFCSGVSLGTSVSGSTGTYSFTFTRSGYGSSALLMFALPHHVASFDSATASQKKTALTFSSPTKGVMTAVVSNSWTMVESAMPTNIGWLPVKSGAPPTFRPEYLTQQSQVAITEMGQDMDAITNLDNMYFSGKALAKYAYICLSFSDVLNDPVNARACIAKLKPAFERFSNNNQQFPLVYESNVWRGLITSAGYVTGDWNADFGSGVYNDHHFHYSYFIQTASIIGYLDKKLNSNTAWIESVKPFVNTLIRDACNPSTADTYFPQFRAFDWFHGHSWAKGVTDSWDGKDEESSSEDANFYYSMKLWGMLIGDAAMEARGNLMLAVLKRSVNSYMQLLNSNTNHPANFIQNKVSGILFENKVHHTTYFGAKTEYIQGIHMLPLTPISPYMRPSQFVIEEWNKYWPGGTATWAITDGWRGILWANIALFDPNTSHLLFRAADFSDAWLDGGASRTWYLSFAGMLGGAA